MVIWETEYENYDYDYDYGQFHSILSCLIIISIACWYPIPGLHLAKRHFCIANA